MSNPIYHATPVSELVSAGDVPTEFVSVADGSVGNALDSVLFTDYAVSSDDESLGASVELLLTEELALSVPGLDDVEFVIGGDGSGFTQFRVSVEATDEGVSARLDDVTLALRFPGSILKPMPETPGGPTPDHAQIEVTGSVILEKSGDIRIEGFDSVSLPRSMIGDSGVIISAEDVQFDLSRTGTIPEVEAAGYDASFMGIYVGEATVELPEEMPEFAPEDLVLRDCAIGTGGVSGRLEADYEPTLDEANQEYTGRGGTELFGVPFGLTDVDIEFRQNALVSSRLAGRMLLPFFEDEVTVDVSLGLDGSLGVSISSEDGLVTLEREDVLSFEVESLGFEVDNGFAVVLSGSITLLALEDVDWPAVEVRELRIDDEGNVKVSGGWLELPDQYSVDFYGFTFELTAFGIGRGEDGRKWIGLNGTVQFTDEITAGASVEGLRVSWRDRSSGPTDIGVSFDGLGVEFEVPEVVRFDGAVAFEDRADGQRFIGDIELDLLALDLTINAKLVIGQTSDDSGAYTYMGIYVGAELPQGIPLFSTGLALYGMAGLYANNYEPDKRTDEKWYSVDKSESYYHRGEEGLTDLAGKWTPKRGSMAFGAGVTIGTAPDNGFSFNGRLLLTFVFPGPVIVLEGRANLLKERAELSAGEPTFGAMAVLDNREGNVQFGLDAQYRTPEGGELIDIQASAEAYYDFDDPRAWYVNLGRREPREQRLRAAFLSIFEANAYVMLNPDRLAVGAWYGYDASYSFGPLGVDIEAWIDGNAVVSFNPAHFSGELWLHGKVALRVFGFKIGITADARLGADVFNPFHVVGDFSVSLELPWPLPDPSAEVTVEWGPVPEPPALPNPLKEVALEHQYSTATWRLPRSKASDPEGGEYDPLLVSADDAGGGPPEKLPIVPPDVRPQLSFNRPVHDEDGVSIERTGWNAQPVEPEYERLGDPAAGEGPVEVRYALDDVRLSAWRGDRWEDAGEVFGAWTPWPAIPQSGSESLGENRPAVGNTKLTLYTYNPFEAFRNGASGLVEDLPLEEYPCPPGKQCYAYEDSSRQELLIRRRYDDDVLTIAGQVVGTEPDEIVASNWRRAWPTVRHLFDPRQDEEPELYTSPGTDTLRCRTTRHSFRVRIELPQPFQSVSVDFSPEKYARNLTVTAIDEDGNRTSEDRFISGRVEYTHTSEDVKVVAVEIVTSGWQPGRTEEETPFHTIDIYEVCAADHGLDEPDPRIEAMQGAIERYGESGPVLEPDTVYRLEVDTNTDANDADGFGWSNEIDRTEYAYFKTGSAPGVSDYATPIGTPEPEEFESGLDDLSRYVEETVPASPEGNNPDLPQPIFRGYDVTVAFNADHVAQLYRGAKRDLTTLLFDANGNPVRRTDGRLFVADREWETVEHTPTEADRDLQETIKDSSCLFMDTRAGPDDALGAGGFLLDADTTYDAVLRPVVLRDRFADASGWLNDAGDWSVDNHKAFSGEDATIGSDATEVVLGSTVSGLVPGHDLIYLAADTNRSSGRYRIDAVDGQRLTLDGEPSFSGGSDWEIPAAGVASVATVPVDDLAVYEFDGLDAGRAEATASPADWTDYRVAATIESPSTDVMLGVDVRRSDTGRYRYLVTSNGTRRLVAIDGDGETELASADRDRPSNESYDIVIEAVGDRIRVYESDDRILAATDDRHGSGTVTLVADTEDVTAQEVCVDDVRADGLAVYRFPFVSSQYASFFHQLHSYQDETWSESLPSGADLTDAVSPPGLGSGSSQSPAPPTESEYAALNEITADLDSPSPERVEVSRVADPQGSGDPDPRALLLRSPEPIDWSRTHVDLKRATTGTSLGLPGRVKLVSASLSGTESVQLLARRGTNLSGWRVETEVAKTDGTGEPLLTDPFADGLDDWTFVDEPPYSIRESDWRIENGSLVQRSNIYGFVGGPYNQPGTFGVVGDTDWTDYELSVEFQSHDDDAIGVLFRYQDPDNFYRFSMDAERNYRRLVKRENGRAHLLWADDDPHELGDLNSFTVRCHGPFLTGQLDGQQLFDLTDTSHGRGSVGVYCRANVGAGFESLSVHRLETEWVTYHEFDDYRLPDGEQLHVHGGSRSNPPLGTQYRQCNGTADLNDYRATVRVVTDDGDVVHERTFRPFGDYHSVPTRVLRGGDGTDLLVTTPSGLPPGQYRLVLTYRRAGDPDRPRGGELGVEQVALDVPWEPIE